MKSRVPLKANYLIFSFPSSWPSLPYAIDYPLVLSGAELRTMHCAL